MPQQGQQRKKGDDQTDLNGLDTDVEDQQRPQQRPRPRLVDAQAPAKPRPWIRPKQNTTPSRSSRPGRD